MMMHLLRRFMLLCLILLVPLQGLAFKAAHACPLQKAAQQARLVQKAHPSPAASFAPSADHASADHVLPGQSCVSHGSIAWMATVGAAIRTPVLPAGRFQAAAASRFSSFIPRQPQRPPLSLSA